MDCPMTSSWQPLEADCDQILHQFPHPLHALAARQTPALVLRKAYNPTHCTDLMQCFTERGYFDRATVGLRVRQLAAGPRQSGRHIAEWDGRDGAGGRVTPGVYLARVKVETDKGNATRLRPVAVVY